MKFKKGDVVILAREENMDYDGEIGLVFIVNELFETKKEISYSNTDLMYWYKEDDLDLAPPVLSALIEELCELFDYEEEE
jgi:hypothetical protein